MLCELCHQKPATVHLTEIVDDNVMEIHLCEECAHEKGAQMEQHFGLSELLAGLADLGKQFPETSSKVLKCSNCGLKYEDFKRIGRLGCGECYKSFKKSLIPLLRRIHGATSHIGKAPEKGATRRKRSDKKVIEVEDLRKRMLKAIEIEEFEEAARLRDKIKQIESAEDDVPAKEDK